MPGPGKGASSRGGVPGPGGTWFRGSGPGGGGGGWSGGLGCPVQGVVTRLGGLAPGVCVETPPRRLLLRACYWNAFFLVLNKIGCLLIYFRVFSTAVVYSFNLLIS